LVKEKRTDEVIVGGKLIDACSSLEAEDIDVKVLACKRKTVLPRKLASD